MKTLARRLGSLLLATGLTAGSLLAAPLKVAYSDWPGWTALAIAEQKGWFKEAGVEVELLWFEYGPSMEAFTAGKVDAVAVTNGDSLVTGAGGAKNVAVLITDYSNGNDMIVAKPGISSIKDLKGKKIGIEVGFVEHLMLLNALKKNGLAESDVTIVPTPTNQTPQVLASGQVDAIGCSTTVAAQIDKRAPCNAYENKFLLRQQVMAVAMRPGQAELLSTVDDFVARNTANGELNKLYRKWLETDLPKLQ